MEYLVVSQADADWRKFKKLKLESLRTDQQSFGASYADQMKKPDSRWKEGLARTEKPLFFIESGGAYVAMAGAKPMQDGIYMLISVYVLPEFRGKGFAQMLVKMVEVELKRRGIAEVDLVVNKEQHEAVGLYRKLGYSVISETEEPMGDGAMHPCLFMSKKIIS